jgi:hypothetical protein
MRFLLAALFLFSASVLAQDVMAQSVNVVDYGAVGDGITNDSAAIQAAINFQRDAPGGGEVYVPAGTYLVNDLRLYSDITLRGAGPTASILKHTGGSDYYVVRVNGSGAGTPDIADNQRNIFIRDLQLRGTVDEGDTFNQHRHLLFLSAVSDILIENVYFIGMRGDGIYVGSDNTLGNERHNTNVTIRGCFFDGLINNNRQAISIIDGDNILIENNVFDRISRPDMPGVIDIEPNTASEAFYIVNNIVINNNTFRRSNGLSAILWWTPYLRTTRYGYNFTVTNNIFEASVNTNSGMPVIGIYTGQTAEDPPMSIIIEGNTILAANDRWLGLSNVFNNVSVRNNIVKNGRGAELGYLWRADGNHGTAIEDAVFANNYFENFNSWNFLSFWNPKNVTIENNTFANFTLPSPPPTPYTFIYFNTAWQSDSNVSIRNNLGYRGDTVGTIHWTNTYTSGMSGYSSDPDLYYNNQTLSGWPPQLYLSGLLPASGSQIARSTNRAQLQVETTVAASCRWSYRPNVDWNNMTEYVSTGELVHSGTLPVVSGGVYRVCSRCYDSSRAEYSADSCTSFSVEVNPKFMVW